MDELKQVPFEVIFCGVYSHLKAFDIDLFAIEESYATFIASSVLLVLNKAISRHNGKSGNGCHLPLATTGDET